MIEMILVVTVSIQVYNATEQCLQDEAHPNEEEELKQLQHHIVRSILDFKRSSHLHHRDQQAYLSRLRS